MKQGIYSLPTLLAETEAGKTFDYLCFWSHRPFPIDTITASCLSQWWACSFNAEGHTWTSAEHWMMAGKARLFGDNDKLAQIMEAPGPLEAKNLGSEVAGFDEAVWEAQCFDLVCEGNYHKFSQNPALKAFLLNTGSQILVEASPVDRIWGIGLAQEHKDACIPSRWQGENKLGFALMKVRDRLASE